MIRMKFTKRLHTVEGELDLIVDEELEERSFVTLFGKSGAGKTTMLRILAGLTRPDSGYIQVSESVWFDSERRINYLPQRRSTGFVFQDYALFPNMTVRQNIEFASDSYNDRGRISELLDIIDLKELQDKKPANLSGGQKQRVALARSLVRNPKLLLLDEPLSALDAEMRAKLQDLIFRIHKQFEITTILVSHDLGEIFKLSNVVLVIDRGKIIKAGNPSEIFAEDGVGAKFQFIGEILGIQKDEMVYIVTLLIGNNIVKVIATGKEVRDVTIGDKMIITTKALNPMLMKIGKDV